MSKHATVMHQSALRALLFTSFGVCLAVSGLPEPGLAQANLRNTFPGRRVGGGTRGECSARILAHLVPGSSVYSAGSSGDLAVVQGPTANPVSLTMVFKPKAGGASTQRTFPASPAALILVSGGGVTAPTLWESGFDCASADSASADPLAFVETASPPAVSLLVPTSDPSDASVQVGLKSLRSSCGSSVPTTTTLETFGLADLVTAEWPKQIPVRCPS